MQVTVPASEMLSTASDLSHFQKHGVNFVLTGYGMTSYYFCMLFRRGRLYWISAIRKEHLIQTAPNYKITLTYCLKSSSSSSSIPLNPNRTKQIPIHSNRIHNSTLASVLPILQVFPVHCGGQRHSKPLSRSMHVPPWAQGLEAHSSISAIQAKTKLFKIVRWTVGQKNSQQAVLNSQFSKSSFII